MLKKNNNLLAFLVLSVFLSMFIIFVVPTEAIVLVDENYNDLSNGQALPGWTVGVFAQNQEFKSPSMGAKVTTNIPFAYRDFPLTQGIIIVEVWMKPKMGSDTNNGLRLGNYLTGKNDAGDYNNGRILFWKNDQDKWWYDNGAGEPVFIADYDGNWHHFKVVYDTSTNKHDLYMDGSLVKTDIPCPVDLSAGISAVGLNSGRWGRYPDTTSYFDDLKVYTSEITVVIDIKPGSDPNAINPNSKGVTPVAILTTPELDASTVDPLSVKFGPAGATEVHKQGHIEDVDGDGDLDMVLHFKTQETGIKVGDTEACLTGKTVDGNDIKGCDAVVTVPSKGKPAPAKQNRLGPQGKLSTVWGKIKER